MTCTHPVKGHEPCMACLATDSRKPRKAKARARRTPGRDWEPPRAAAQAILAGARLVKVGAALVTVDPGTASTGWCVHFEGAGSWDAGQDPGPAEACRSITAALRGKAIGLLVVEEPFLIGVGRQWKLAWASGEARGRLAMHQVDEEAVWMPPASVWRAALRIGNGRRDDVNEKIHTLMEAHFRVPIRTRTGQPALDEANARAMGLASVTACVMVRRNGDTKR